MSVELYRLADPRYNGDLVQAVAGIGGLFGPARWHVKGYRIVYMATTLSLATLEMKVQDMGMKPAYAAFKITVPDKMSRRRIDTAQLPANWRTREAYPECQALGLAPGSPVPTRRRCYSYPAPWCRAKPTTCSTRRTHRPGCSKWCPSASCRRTRACCAR